MNDNFVVFILTHGRPDNVITYKTLARNGYTGKIFVVIDNEDKCASEYVARYGDSVLVFDKAKVASEFDTGDNFSDRRAVVFARNACLDLAKEVGVEYFLQLDDDYIDFVYKFTTSFAYKERRVKSLDAVFDAMIEFYKSIDAISIAFGQNGDFIGGRLSRNADSIKMIRKCMNTFFCCVHRSFTFVGRVNEDVNTYTSRGNVGDLMLSILQVAIIQKQTQSNSGGMTELYLNEGTYIKSFYTVMYSPSCVHVSMMGDKHKRLHHEITWDDAVPLILPEGCRKI